MMIPRRVAIVIVSFALASLLLVAPLLLLYQLLNAVGAGGHDP